MLNRKIVLLAAVPIVLGILGVLAVAHAQSPRAAASLTALDYAEIQQLYSRYAIGIDSGNAEMFAGVFTPEGTFVINGRTFQGRKQLTDMAAAPGGDKGPNNVSHIITNVTIDPAPEGATGTAYFLRATIGKNRGPSTLDGGGIYRDTIVKTSEGWRIKKRVGQRAHTKPE